jgi:hypothetical protein
VNGRSNWKIPVQVEKTPSILLTLRARFQKKGLTKRVQPLKQVGFLVPPALPVCRSRSRSYMLSPGVTSRGSHGRSLQDINRRIDIPVMFLATFSTAPLPGLQ